MFKRSFAIILACLLVQMLCVQPATAKSKEEKQAQLTQKVVEITPPVRTKRQNWNLTNLTQIAQSK